MVSIALVHPGQFYSVSLSTFLVVMVLKSPCLQCWCRAWRGSGQQWPLPLPDLEPQVLSFMAQTLSQTALGSLGVL